MRPARTPDTILAYVVGAVVIVAVIVEVWVIW
jgi:hypothetical protein